MKAHITSVEPQPLWALKNSRFVAGSAADLFGLDFSNMAGWSDFQNYWNELELDRYMNDGGRYRYRRFGKFKWYADGNRLEQQPHVPYSQPEYFNPLNGGIDRHFAPVTAEMADNEVLRRILLELANAYSEIEDVQSWKINTYFNRILATPNMQGLPVPEGKHRDGVKFSCLFMVDRSGVAGGETTLVDIMHQQPIYVGTLEKPCQTVVFRDDTVFHDTTAIEIIPGADMGYRDLLVIEFH
ncbi:2OG-Fe dioxygenase family protein [Pseudomonas rossensis]|uniref:2OG-Fe dioxygenase family protein n=1 Tax=Pseudomonas rossensis TaxID=2305471 RepID=UPI003261D1A5